VPLGGVKCPDCGHRFHARTDKIKAESTTDEQAFLCPGNGSKGKHEPRIVKIMRINKGTLQELVKIKIIQARSAELMAEFQDQWFEENKRKYRPDLVFGARKS